MTFWAVCAFVFVLAYSIFLVLLNQKHKVIIALSSLILYLFFLFAIFNVLGEPKPLSQENSGEELYLVALTYVEGVGIYILAKGKNKKEVPVYYSLDYNLEILANLKRAVRGAQQQRRRGKSTGKVKIRGRKKDNMVFHPEPVRPLPQKE